MICAVIQCRPKLETSSLSAAVDKLNETRNFALFLKEMRYLFKDQVSNSEL